MVPTVIPVLAGCSMALGLFALWVAWVFPEWVGQPAMRWLVLGQRLAPTRANTAIEGAWVALVGFAYLLIVSGRGAPPLGAGPARRRCAHSPASQSRGRR